MSKGKQAYLKQYIMQTYISRPGKIKYGNISIIVNRRNSIWTVGMKSITVIAMAGLNVMHKGMISNSLNRGVKDNCKP